MENDGVGKVKFKRRQDAKKPYERRQSLLGRVGSTVKDMLKPSWLVDLVSSVKRRSPPNSPSSSNTVFQPDGYPQNSYSAGQGMSNRPEPRPPLSHQQMTTPHQMQMPGMHPPPPYIERPTEATGTGSLNKPADAPAFTSDSLPFRSHYKPPQGNIVLNGEDDNSEYSVSTSGCSSMVPRPDQKDYQREVLLMNESKIQQLRQDLGSSSTPSKDTSSCSSQQAGPSRAQLHSCVAHVRGLPPQATEQDVIEYFKPLVPTSVLFTASGGADVEFSSHDEAQRAVNRARPTMHHRPVDVSLKPAPAHTGGNRDASRANQSRAEEASFLWSNEDSPSAKRHTPQPPAKKKKVPTATLR